jgi:hypothetical protein
MRFLTEEEIFNLTGHKTASKQSRWLEQNGIHHWINSKNKVQITDTSIELALQHNKPVISTPNFAALERSSRI